MFENLKKKLPFEINSIQFVKRGKSKFLEIELPDSSLLSIEEKSKLISEALDDLNLINENYYLDVYSSGTEKEIKLDKINLYLSHYVLVETLNKHYLDKNSWEGYLIENNLDNIVLKINNKGRFQKLKIKKIDITYIKTTAKIRKEV